LIPISVQLGLLSWYLFSLVIAVPTDQTFSTEFKMLGAWINLTVIGYILSNVFNKNSGVMFYQFGLILLGWYCYFTPQDLINPGYSFMETFIYVSIDIITIIYLISTLFISFYMKNVPPTFSIQYQYIKINSIGWSFKQQKFWI
jgi:hypothetical protein